MQIVSAHQGGEESVAVTALEHDAVAGHKGLDGAVGEAEYDIVSIAIRTRRCRERHLQNHVGIGNQAAVFAAPGRTLEVNRVAASRVDVPGDAIQCQGVESSIPRGPGQVDPFDFQRVPAGVAQAQGNRVLEKGEVGFGSDHFGLDRDGSSGAVRHRVGYALAGGFLGGTDAMVRGDSCDDRVTRGRRSHLIDRRGHCNGVDDAEPVGDVPALGLGQVLQALQVGALDQVTGTIAAKRCGVVALLALNPGGGQDQSKCRDANPDNT